MARTMEPTSSSLSVSLGSASMMIDWPDRWTAMSSGSALADSFRRKARSTDPLISES